MSSVGQGSQAHSALANSRISTVQPHRDNDDEHRGPVCRLECSTPRTRQLTSSPLTLFNVVPIRHQREASAQGAQCLVRSERCQIYRTTVTISRTTWVLCDSTLLRCRGSRLHEEQPFILRKGDLRILTVTRSGKSSRTYKAPRKCACVRSD